MEERYRRRHGRTERMTWERDWKGDNKQIGRVYDVRDRGDMEETKKEKGRYILQRDKKQCD